jgi:steroid delta-isomerase-like uncharacterized protein
VAGEANKALFRRYFDEGTNAGDVAVVDEIFDPNYSHHDPANPDVIVGSEGVKRHITTLRGAFPDIKFEVQDMIGEGDDIVIRWIAHVTHTGDYFGIPPTGKSATITGVNYWRMKNGKAVEGWVCRDDLGLMQQLGLIPSQG